ncbi:MAG: hypothetical protein ABI600_15525 [Luteolibacter sp.]
MNILQLIKGTSLGLILALTAHAAPIFYDGMNFDEASDSRDVQSTWTGNDYMSVESPGLVYPNLAVQGRTMRSPNQYGRQMFASLPSTQPATGVYWLSFLTQLETASVSGVGISLFDDGDEKSFFGSGTGSKWGNWSGDGQFNGSTTTANTTLLTVKIDMTSGKYYMWVNPTVTSVAPIEADAINGPNGTAFTPYAFNRLRLGVFFGGGKGAFDEIRLGATAADVGFVNPPSPLIAYDSISYSNGTQLAAQNGGTGWTSAWSAQANRYEIQNPGLSYGTLMTTGGYVAKFDNPAFGNGTSRFFAAQSGRVWASALVNFQQIPSYFEFKLNEATNVNWSAKFGLSNGNLFVDHSGNGAGANSPFTPQLNQTYLLVFTYDSTGATPTAIYVNPDVGVADPVNSLATASFNGTNWGMSGGIGQLSSFAGDGLFKLDEIRVGSTFAAVTPAGIVANGLQSFRTTNGLASDGSQDLATPANDGVSNLLKYAFNMIGTGTGQATSIAISNTAVLAPAGSAGLPRGGQEPGTQKLTITYIRRKASSNSGINYTVQFSDVLTTWAPNPLATESITSVDSTFERVTVTDSVIPPAKRFARVSIASL